MKRAEFGPEFALLIRCCLWNFANAGEDARPEIPPLLDWSRFLAVARRHRVQGLTWSALVQQADQMPDCVRDVLSSDARAIAATNLAIAKECSDLLRDFQQAGVQLLFVKGLTVGALAYRSPMTKMGWDIDLLIDPDGVKAAAGLLGQRGYAVQLPTTPAQLWSWHSRSKESVWSREGTLHVELHTRLADNPRLIAGIDVHSARQTVEVTSGTLLPTLSRDELFAYLAVHGASSAWFRLKWISDLAAMLHGRDAAELRRLYVQSQELGAGRSAGQAMLLADALFCSLRSVPDLKEHLHSDRATRLLCRAALKMMANEGEPTERPFGTLPIHWTQLLLRPDLDFKLSELWRQIDGLRH